MKKIMLIISFAAILCSSQTTFAQDKKNVVKLNLTGLGVGSFYLQYERALSSNISVALGASFLVPRSAQMKKFINPDSTTFKKDQLSGFSITPEVRFYLGKKDAPRGFYIAPYLRYNYYKMDLDVDARVNLKDGTKNQLMNFKGIGAYNSFGGGIMIGAQWLVADKISIDWWILGLGYNKTIFSIESKGDYSNLDLDNTVNEINAASVLVKEYGTANDKEIKAQLEMPGLGLRMGLALGYAF